MSIISENIRKYRKLRGLDQSQLAELMGVSDKTISSWEVGRTEPKMGKVEKLCQILKISTSTLLGLDIETPFNTLNDTLERATAYAEHKESEYEKIIKAYKKAPEQVKDIICKILDVKR